MAIGSVITLVVVAVVVVNTILIILACMPGGTLEWIKLSPEMSNLTESATLAEPNLDYPKLGEAEKLLLFSLVLPHYNRSVYA